MKHAILSQKGVTSYGNYKIVCQERNPQHLGACDASTPIAMNEAYFVVANDEDNIFKVYHAEQSGEMIRGI